MIVEFKAVEFMREVREANGEQHALNPEVLLLELAEIRERFKHLIKTQRNNAKKVEV